MSQYARQSTGSSGELGIRRHRPDYGLLVIASILLAVGLVVMYAISPALAAQGGGVSDNYFVSRQFIAIIFGFFAFWVTSRVPFSFWERWQKPLIITTFVLCLATIAMGGIASRWIQLGAFSFQPVEFVKFTLVVLLASFLAKAASSGNLQSIKSLQPLALTFAAFGFVIVILQRDLGSAFVLMAMTAIMAYIAGLPMKRLFIFGGIAFAVIILAISSTAYRRDRFLTFIQPERDCADAGYHACQALIAVGSGGVLGVGVGRSVQAYGYLPEAANDSIFAIYAEKFGFVGVVALLLLIGSLLLRILNIMARAPNEVTRLMCAGVFAWLGVQAAVNIGAMLGLLPLKGITLPFISYGGTSLIFVMAALGLVFQISMYTSMRKSLGKNTEGAGKYESTHDRRRVSRPYYSNPKRSY
jgi:cell division protein FtsW